MGALEDALKRKGAEVEIESEDGEMDSESAATDAAADLFPDRDPAEVVDLLRTILG